MHEIQETQVWFLGQEDPLEKEMATHSSILAGKIPCTEEPGGLQSMGSQRDGHNLELECSNINQLNLIPMETSTAAESKLSTSVTTEPTEKERNNCQIQLF